MAPVTPIAVASCDCVLHAIRELSGAARADMIGAVQAVFVCAAPLAALGLVVTLLLRETPLQGWAAEPAPTAREETA